LAARRGGWPARRDGCWTWRRPTLPRLETQYHGRFGVSRPSSEWGRVGHPRYGHQVEEPSPWPRRGQAAQRSFGLRPRGDPGPPLHGSGEEDPSREVAGSGMLASLDGRGTRLLAACGCRWGGSRSIERLGPVSCTRCRAFTSGLSTWWSTTALRRDLVLRKVSRLDAFSGYPVRT
jgi:hypothetical protein